jgi:hypothetical protein
MDLLIRRARLLAEIRQAPQPMNGTLRTAAAALRDEAGRSTPLERPR